MTALKQALRRALLTSFGVKSEVNNDTKLFTGGVLDSLSVMDLVCFVEEQLKCMIRPADITMENFDSIDRIQRFADKLSAQNVPA